MKTVLHPKKKDVFSQWLHSHLEEFGGSYIWPQICYDWESGKLIHVVFEKNRANEEFVKWPVNNENIPTTNIDFTADPPTLDSGEPWDFHNWHEEALKCRLMNDPQRTPVSFWEWRRQTRPQGNGACDLDFFCMSARDEYIGLEATEIYYVEEDSNVNRDVFEHFKRLLTYRKGATGGFNVRQLSAQKDFVAGFSGRLFLLLHQIEKNTTPWSLRDDLVRLLEIDDQTFERVSQLVTQDNHGVGEDRGAYDVDPMDYIKPRLRPARLATVMNRFLQDGE